MSQRFADAPAIEAEQRRIRTTERAAWTEKRFLAEVIRVARALSWRVYHTHDSRRSPEGFPDLVLVRDPGNGACSRLIFAELKSERGRLSEDQRLWLEALTRSGVAALVWRPRNWESILEVLR